MVQARCGGAACLAMIGMVSGVLATAISNSAVKLAEVTH